MRTGDTRYRSTKTIFAYMHKHTNRYIWGTTQTVWRHYRLKETATVVQYWISCLVIHTQTHALCQATKQEWCDHLLELRGPLSLIWWQLHSELVPYNLNITFKYTGYLLHIFLYWANLNSLNRPVIVMQKRVNKQGCWNWLLAETNHDFPPQI